MVAVDFIIDTILEAPFENMYPEEMRIPSDIKHQMLQKTQATFISIVDKETREPIGECFYLPLDLLEQHMTELHAGAWMGKQAAYIYKNSILPEYQGKGYGKLLTDFRLAHLKKQGFKYSIGHARHNRSIKQARMFGATVVSEIDNWSGSGETVSLCVLDLTKFSEHEIDRAAVKAGIASGYQYTEKIAYQDGYRAGIIFAQQKQQ